MLTVAIIFALLWLFIATLVVAIQVHPTRRPSLAPLAALCIAVSAFMLTLVSGESATDRPRYVRSLNRFIADPATAFRDVDFEPVFLIYLWVASRFEGAETVLSLILAGTSLICIFFGVGIRSRPGAAVVVSGSYVLTGFFTAYSANGLRQGLAMAFVYLALGISARRGFGTTALIFLLLGFFSHFASFVNIAVAALILYLNPRPRLLFWIWSVSLLGFLSGQGFQGGQRLSPFSATLDAYIADLPQNRIDFLVVQIAVLVIAGLYWRFGIANHNDRLYVHSLQMLLAQSSAFLLFGFVAYSNRLAAFVVLYAVTVLWLPLFEVRGVNGGLTRILALVAFSGWGISPLGVFG